MLVYICREKGFAPKSIFQNREDAEEAMRRHEILAEHAGSPVQKLCVDAIRVRDEVEDTVVAYKGKWYLIDEDIVYFQNEGKVTIEHPTWNALADVPEELLEIQKKLFHGRACRQVEQEDINE